MSQLKSVVFACAHLCDQRLFAPQVSALQPYANCQTFAFPDCDSLGAMAEKLLADAPEKFTLIGLSLGGYLAFEIIRRAPSRLAGLVLIDTRADADDDARIANRHRMMDVVKNGGIDALIPELPPLWMHPLHAADPVKRGLLENMARNIGATGQRNQQTAMLARPDSIADLHKVRVPTLIICGREDLVTPLASHEEMQRNIVNAQLKIIEQCGHLSTIEQPDAVTILLREWLLAQKLIG